MTADQLTYFLGGASFTVILIFLALIVHSIVARRTIEEPMTIEAVGIPLAMARLCLDCDLVYNNGRDSSCPKCTSTSWVYASHWLALPETEQLELVYPGAAEGSNS